jgi:hypothetical protein
MVCVQLRVPPFNEQGFDGDVIESALAHQEQNEVRKAYNRAQYLERRRVLMCWWSEHIENAIMSKNPIVTNIKQLKVI